MEVESWSPVMSAERDARCRWQTWRWPGAKIEEVAGGGQRKISGGRAEIGGALQQGPSFHPWASSRLPFFPLFPRGSSKVDVDDNGTRTRPLSTQWALRIQGHQGHQQGHVNQVDCNTYFISNATVDTWECWLDLRIDFSCSICQGLFSIQHVFASDTFDGRIANMSSLQHVVLR